MHANKRASMGNF